MEVEKGDEDVSSLVTKEAIIGLTDLTLHLHSLIGGSREAFHCC